MAKYKSTNDNNDATGPEQTTPQQQSPDDLVWIAFQYYGGELSADEAEAFEEDLAVEQSAREALAEAVELAEAVHSLPWEDRSMPARPAERTKRAGRVAWWQKAWAAAAAVGSVSLVLALYLIWTSSGGQSQVVEFPDVQAAAKAQAWAVAEVVELEDVHPGEFDDTRPFEHEPVVESDPMAEDVAEGPIDPDLLMPVFPNLYLAHGGLIPEDGEEM